MTKQELAKKLKKVEREERKKAIKERPPFKGLQIRPTVSLFDQEGKKEPGENNWAGFDLICILMLLFFQCCFW